MSCLVCLRNLHLPDKSGRCKIFFFETTSTLLKCKDLISAKLPLGIIFSARLDHSGMFFKIG